MPYTNEQIILFFYPNTIGSRKMLLVLYTRGISFMPRVMDVLHGEQMEPWFLDMSPLGELPVLKHGDSIFTDVDQMMLYIDQICPSTDPVGKLFPDRGTELGNMVESLVKDLSKINIPLIVYGTLFHPEMAVSSGMTDDEQKKKANATQTWLFSIYVSAADIYLMVLLHAVYKAGLWDRYFEKTQKKHKNLTRYFKRMRHDPLISKALPGLINALAGPEAEDQVPDGGDADPPAAVAAESAAAERAAAEGPTRARGLMCTACRVLRVRFAASTLHCSR
ncbi:ganglioside induced differentiation associated protein 1 isoform X2 [Amblyomma americanum]